MGLATSGSTGSGGSARALQRKGNIVYEVRDEGVQDGGRASPGDRVSVYEAAKVLGVTVDAIRKRAPRGTIRHERDDNGRVWVLLDASSTVPDNVQDNYRAISDEPVDELRERVRYLRETLGKGQEARRRADSIIAQLTQTNVSPAPPSARTKSLTRRAHVPTSASGSSGCIRGSRRAWVLEAVSGMNLRVAEVLDHLTAKAGCCGDLATSITV
jgi:hypothetical protein